MIQGGELLSGKGFKSYKFGFGKKMDEVLFRKLERLKDEISFLKTYREEFLKTIRSSVEKRKLAERSIYLCAEIVLDISDYVIILRGLPKPSTYSDSIYKLGENKIIPKDFSHKFVFIAGVRNFLAHDYEVNTCPVLEKFLKSGIIEVEKFIKYMELL